MSRSAQEIHVRSRKEIFTANPVLSTLCSVPKPGPADSLKALVLLMEGCLPTAPWHSQPPACACSKHFLAKSCFSSRNGASNFCHCALCLHGSAPTHNIQLPVTAPYYQPNSINSTDKTQIISKLVSCSSAQCWHHFLCSAGILAFNPPLNKMPKGDHSVLLFCNLTASHPAPVARVFTDLRLQNLLALPEDLGQSQCMLLSGYFWTTP